MHQYYLRTILFAYLFCAFFLNLVSGECSNGTIQVTIVRHYKKQCNSEFTYLYSGYPNRLVQIADFESQDGCDIDVNRTLCLKQELYMFDVRQENGLGWYSGSSLDVYIGDFFIYHNYLNRKQSDQWFFYPYYLISEVSIWKMTSTRQYEVTWYSTTYNDSSWTNLISNTQFRFQAITQYFRYSFLLTDLPSGLNFYNFFFYTQYGYVIYFNGDEVTRRYINSGQIIHPDLYSPQKDTTSQIQSVSGRLLNHFSLKGFNSIAIEIHIYQGEGTPSCIFNPSMFLLYGESLLRSSSSLLQPVDTSIDTTNFNNLLDENLLTSWKCTLYNNNCMLKIQFPERHYEFINSYSITTSQDRDTSDPMDFTLYGSTNNQQYIPIDIRKHAGFQGRNEAKQFFLFSNIIPYRYYRFDIHTKSGDSDTISVAEFAFYLYDLSRLSVLKYSNDNIIAYKDIDTLEIAPMTAGFSSYIFDSSPFSLPKGLSYNSNTGIISGIPESLFNNTIRISAINQQLYTTDTTYIHLAIITCEGPNMFYINISQVIQNKTTNDEYYKLYIPLKDLYLNYKDYSFTSIFNQITNTSEYSLYYDSTWTSYSQYIYSIENIHTSFSSTITEILINNNNTNSTSNKNYLRTTNTLFCVPSNFYIIQLIDRNADIWATSSFITISYISTNDEYPLFKSTLYHTESSSYLLHLNFNVFTKNRNTYCYNSLVDIPPSSWYTPNYSIDSSWKSCLYDDDSTILNTNNHYMISKFHINHSLLYQSVAIRLYSMCNVDMYLNGYSIYTIHLCSPNNTISIDTSTDIYSYRTVHIDSSYLREGENTLAIHEQINTTQINNISQRNHYYYYHNTKEEYNNKDSTILRFRYTVLCLCSSSHSSRTINSLIYSPVYDSPDLYNLIDKNLYSSIFIYENNITSTTDISSKQIVEFPVFIETNIPSSVEYMNRYCIHSAYLTHFHQFFTITVYGCMYTSINTTLSTIEPYRNNTTIQCILIDTVTNITFSPFNHLYCRHINSHSISYTLYKFIISTESIATSLFFSSMSPSKESPLFSLSEIGLYSLNFASILISPLSYPYSNVIVYRFNEISTLIPSPYYSQFYIEKGILPKGLSLDSTMGYITGTILDSLGNYTITIAAYSIENQLMYTTLCIQVITCDSPFGSLLLQFKNILYDSSPLYSFSIINKEGISVVHQPFVDAFFASFTYCLPFNSYILILEDEQGLGWGKTTVNLYLNGKYPLGKYSIGYQQYIKKIPFVISDSIDFYSTSWTFRVNKSIPLPLNNDWMISEEAPSDWTLGTLSSISNYEDITQYFRTTLYIVDLSQFIGLFYNIYTTCGIILYINGIELTRMNMLLYEVIQYNTPCLLYYEDGEEYSQSIYISNMNDFFHNGNNIISFEMHGYTINTINNLLDFDIYLIYDSIDRTPLGSVITKMSLLPGYDTRYLTDGTQFTKWKSYRGNIFDNIITFKFDSNIYEYITTYSISNTYDCNNMIPSGWLLFGSNDDNHNLELLSTVQNHYFTSYGDTSYFNIIIHKPYKWYTFFFNEFLNKEIDTTYTISNNNKTNDSIVVPLYDYQSDIPSFIPQTNPQCTLNNLIQLSSIHFFITKPKTYCNSTSDGYIAVANNTYSYKMCDSSHIGFKKRLCIDGIFQEEDSSDCHLILPTDFYYYEYILTLLMTSPSLYLTPHYNGINLTFYSVPTLPNGLRLDTSTGIISGIVTQEQSLKTYTITAENDIGSISTDIHIQVLTNNHDIYCDIDGLWPRSTIGSKVYLQCESSEDTGSLYRYCTYSNNQGMWLAPVNNCSNPSNYVSFFYISSTAYILLNHTVQISPITTGIITKWFLSPSYLPKGINFSNGSFSGILHELLNNITYYIFIYSHENYYSQSLTLVTLEKGCMSDDEWPIIPINMEYSLPCEYPNNTGSITRRCEDNHGNAQWGEIHNTCHSIPPQISYSIECLYYVSHVYYVFPVVCIGDCQRYTISPDLPSSLHFNEHTGSIFGIFSTPVNYTTYTVTAYGPYFHSSTTFSWTVLYISCLQELNWPETLKGETAQIPCTDPLKDGNMSRTCSDTNPAYWLEPLLECTYKYPYVHYTSELFYVYLGYNTSIIPITQNYIQNWTIVPSIQDGLLFNTSNGAITGSPKYNLPSISYRIKASNIDRVTTIYLSITSTDLFCDEDNDWPVTSINQTTFINCPLHTPGFITRDCLPKEDLSQSIWKQYKYKYISFSSFYEYVIKEYNYSLQQHPHGNKDKQMNKDTIYKNNDIYKLNNAFTKNISDTIIYRSFAQGIWASSIHNNCYKQDFIDIPTNGYQFVFIPVIISTSYSMTLNAMNLGHLYMSLEAILYQLSVDYINLRIYSVESNKTNFLANSTVTFKVSISQYNIQDTLHNITEAMDSTYYFLVAIYNIHDYTEWTFQFPSISVIPISNIFRYIFEHYLFIYIISILLLCIFLFSIIYFPYKRYQRKQLKLNKSLRRRKSVYVSQNDLGIMLTDIHEEPHIPAGDPSPPTFSEYFHLL
ncbi:hypothetical protein WA158_000046 [Blastocystis sp. Blastoise]